ncbi:hypothetical protein Tco_0331199, partial [Tanacetum coccineum]
MMYDPNITIEEYIRLEEEKSRKRGKVFNWETAKYGKIWYEEDIRDLRSVETKFPAIAFNDGVSSEKTLIREPTPAISCFDDLDFFKDLENEFPAIVYNDAQTSKSDLLTEPILNPQHIDEFNLNDETSLNDCGGQDMTLPPHDQRHQYLRYEGLQYSDADIVDFEARLARIYRREVHRVHVFDFGGLPNLMADGLSARMFIEHKDAQGASLFGEAVTDLDTLGALQFHLGGARRRFSWRQFIIPDKGDLRDYWIGISSARDFLGTTSFYTAIRDSILRLCHRLIACSIVGRSQAPEKLFAAGRNSGALIFGGQFVARLAEHFRLLTEERLQGLTIAF